MSLHIVRSTHLEELAAALAEELAAAQRAEPFAPQAVVVGSAGLARWLRRRIATTNGICAGVEFPFPRPALEDLVFRGLYPRVHDEARDPTRWYADYYRTYVERDLRDVLRVMDLQLFDRFVRAQASRGALPRHRPGLLPARHPERGAAGPPPAAGRALRVVRGRGGPRGLRARRARRAALVLARRELVVRPWHLG